VYLEPRTQIHRLVRLAPNATFFAESNVMSTDPKRGASVSLTCDMGSRVENRRSDCSLPVAH
jgi:hypothetical protein